MRATIHPSTFFADLDAPASKSAMQRACAAALIKKGRTELLNYGVSDDDAAAIGIIQVLGAKVTKKEDRTIIESEGIAPVKGHIDCGESGLSLRMFTPLAAFSDGEMIITGRGSLMNRPAGFFDEVLPQLGVSCHTREGKLPLKIKGPLRPADITIDGSLSSQYLTGLLFAFSALDAKATIYVKNLASKPYVDLTLKLMRDFGLTVPVNNNYQSFVFSHAANKGPGSIEYRVEGDWSSASFLLVAAAIAGRVTMKGLDLFSGQADKAILQVLHQCGARMSVNAEEITVERSKLKAFHFNATDCPDLFPPLVALACYCEGSSVIEGAGRLLHKESNRSRSLMEEFSSLGPLVQVQDDLMIIRPAPMQPTRTVHAHHDHRIAMALAIAAIGMQEQVVIENAESVSKSYPQFWDHLSLAGVAVSLSR